MNVRVENRLDDELRPAANVAIAIGPIVALSTAGLLAHFRDTAGSTNVALVLAMVVVVAALAGRTAGFATAVSAALGFNYFHTEPYRSLRINGGRDIVTVILLALIGIVVSEIGAWQRRLRRQSRERLTTGRALENLATMLASGQPTDAIWTTVRDTLIAELRLLDCRFEASGTSGLPTLPRSGSMVGRSMHLTRFGFAFPPGGVVVPVAAHGRTFGEIVLVADERYGSTHDARALAIALADLYALALYFERPALAG